jgi:hypothetical protein
VAAKYLIDHHKAKSAKRNVCYFFFKDGFEDQNNAQSALSAILHQIYCFQPSLLKHAMAKHATTPKRTFKQFPSLLSMLMSTIEDDNLGDTLCIIDGLDECEPKSGTFWSNLLQHISLSPYNQILAIELISKW